MQMGALGYGSPVDASTFGFEDDYHACPPHGGETAPMSPVTRDLIDRACLYARHGGPFPGNGPYPVHTNPFGFGFDLAPPPPTPMPGYGAGGGMDISVLWDHVQAQLSPSAEPAPLPTFPAGGDDIDAILRTKEQRAEERPAPEDYLATTQGGRMGPATRASMVRWMGWVARLFGPVPGTLHRAVSYFDRFLSLRPLADAGVDDQLRLLGAAAVFVAAKHEDQGAVKEHANATDLSRRCGVFATARDVLAAERALLDALGYRLGGPTAFTFVERFMEHYGDSQGAQEVRHAAHWIAELSLRDYGCVKLLPSAVAAAAIFLARLTLRPSYGQVRRWNRELKEVTGYKPRDLEYAVEAMCALMRNIQLGRGGRFDVVIFPVLYADP
jgi:hypothetical protein